MSPRQVPASITELSRIGLLSSLPGETLTRLAARMLREEVPAGRTIVAEGERGDRFYVLLSGMATVTQEHRGPRSVLRPGETFGEVALAMGIPRTATVTAMLPSVVASCDRATFDELLRPLYADDDPDPADADPDQADADPDQTATCSGRPGNRPQQTASK